MSGPIPVIAVSGVKNSGKTTLLVNLIPVLRARGLSLAAIKHDGHDFSPDIPGTDSARLRAAGAETVAIYSARRFALFSDRPGAGVEQLVSLIEGVDLILVEGAKGSDYPKLEIVRGANSSQSVCTRESLLALCTDTDLRLPGIPTVGLDDYRAMADIIGRHLAALGSSNKAAGHV